MQDCYTIQEAAAYLGYTEPPSLCSNADWTARTNYSSVFCSPLNHDLQINKEPPYQQGRLFLLRGDGRQSRSSKFIFYCSNGNPYNGRYNGKRFLRKQGLKQIA